MKKMICCCLLLLLLLVGCNETTLTQAETAVLQSDTHSFVSEGLTDSTANIDSYASEDRAQANLRDHFVETADGYYYQDENLIYFSQRGSTAFYPLCSKPNCMHNDENCNAWCGSAFGYYNGALYSVVLKGFQNEFQIVKMNLDGTDHEKVASFSAGNGGGFSFTFHHGSLYIYQSANLSLPLEEQRDRFIKMDLSDFSQTEPFVDYLGQENSFSAFCYYKNKIYAYAANSRDPSVEASVVEMNTDTGEVKILVPFQLGAAFATEDTFYYLEPDVGFKEYDLETGVIEDCGLPVADAWWATYDENYIYMMGHGRNNDRDHTLYFFSRDYQLLDQIELTDSLYYGYVTSDRLFFAKGWGVLSFYIDKSDIGTGNLAIKPLDNS